MKPRYSLPTTARRVEALRRGADLRRLLLLEVAILRHAPFGIDGATIWDHLPTFSWYQDRVAPADYIRAAGEYQARGRVGTAPVLDPRALTVMNGREAIEIVEGYADGARTADEMLMAQEYCRWAEYAAEADRFGYDPERLPGSVLRYGVANRLLKLRGSEAALANTFDYYLANFPGTYYCWSRDEPFHPNHRPTALGFIDDIFGNPFRQAVCDPRWRTDTALSLARVMYESRDFTGMPILADSLQDAGCDNDDVLNHCRGEGPHVRGCWVVDLVLGKA